MAKLVFLQRTPQEIEIFGGEVFFDIDGKNAGKLSSLNQIVELPSGEHTIKMYKSHSYDTFIGFAEQTINLSDNDELMIRYSCPMMISQPGNMVISEYSKEKSEELVRSKEDAMQRDIISHENERKEADEKYKNGVWILIGVAVVIGILYAISVASI